MGLFSDYSAFQLDLMKWSLYTMKEIFEISDRVHLGSSKWNSMAKTLLARLTETSNGNPALGRFGTEI